MSEQPQQQPATTGEQQQQTPPLAPQFQAPKEPEKVRKESRAGDTDNVTQQLQAAQQALLQYDKESVEKTQEKYHAYLRLVNETQKSPDIENSDGKNAAQLKEEWEAATKERVEGRKALVDKIAEIINPALSETNTDRAQRLQAIQQQSEKACLEMNMKSDVKGKPELEKAIDELGTAATKEFKESAKLK